MTDNVISFSPWIDWAGRNRLTGQPNEDFGGIYLFARFDHPVPTGPADPLDSSVIYIGQSSKGTFRSRWDPFDRAISNPTTAKYRAKRYMGLFGPAPSFPHVAVMSWEQIVRAYMGIATCPFLDLNGSHAAVNSGSVDEMDDLLIKYMERRLILLHALRNGHRPALNVD